jgi:hypothetical protein
MGKENIGRIPTLNMDVYTGSTELNRDLELFKSFYLMTIE